MFAVPGWAVSADSLASQKPSQESASKSSKTPDGLPTAISKSEKRKRARGDAQVDHKVSGEELETLWNKHFETGAKGSHDGVNIPGIKKDKKGLHNASTLQPATTEPIEDVARTRTGEGAGAKRHKRRKEKKLRSQELIDAAPEQSALAADNGRASKASGTNSVDSSNGIKGTGLSSTVPKTVAKAKPPPIELLPPDPPPPPAAAVLTPLQAKMRNKLTSARFRHLNQTLYTSPSSAALDLFTSSPALFAEYHAGFSQQVKDSWPENPVDGYIRDIKARGKISQPPGRDEQLTGVLPLPRRKTGRCTIADLGCGDAPLARGCQAQTKALSLKFHNYDLHAPNSHVTKADISDLPLRDGEADIVVFCLSLMGTNWISFVEEGWRILRGDGKGEIWVAEVKSRFGRVTRKVVENSVGKKRKPAKPKTSTEEGDKKINGEELFAEDERHGDQIADETDISAFAKVFERRGFALRPASVNKSNKMFVSMIFTKTGVPTAGKHKGMKWNGYEYERLRGPASGRMKFLDNGEEDEKSPEEEAKVLKPCVYKTR